MITTVLSLTITALITASLLIYLIRTSRRLRSLRELCDTALIDVENLQSQLISRLAPIIDISQKVLRDEEPLFTEIKEISINNPAPTHLGQIEAILKLRKNVKHLYKRSLTHVELKDLENLQQLWAKVIITNRNIDESASFYNDAVHDYREFTSKFPASMLADVFHYPHYHRI